jgi:hypothetical protein
MKVLRDPLWQFIGVIITCIGILIPLIALTNPLIIIFAFIIAIILLALLFLRLRPNKTIFFRLLSDTIALSIQEEVKGDLQVLYKGEEVKGDIHLVILRIWNASSDPILPEEYKGNSIKLNFGKEAKILSVQVSDSKPQTIKEEVEDKQSIKLDGNKVVLEPIWLNTDNTLTLKVLLTDFYGVISTDETRIIVGGFVRDWDKTFNKKIKVALDYLLNDTNRSATFVVASVLISFPITLILIVIILNILNINVGSNNNNLNTIISLAWVLGTIILTFVLYFFLFKKYVFEWLSHIYD